VKLIIQTSNDDIAVLVRKEMLIGGKVWISSENNPEEVLKNGGIWVNIEFSCAPPLEQGGFISTHTSKYLLDIIPDYNSNGDE